MGDEEKISLSKPEQRSLQSGFAGLGLHCFPDIQVAEKAAVRRCLPKEEIFQQIKYDNIGPNRTDMVSMSGDDRPRNIRKGSISTAQLNEQAYQRGFADGRKKATIEGEKSLHAQAQEKIIPLLASLQEGLLQLNTIRKETYLEIEKEAVELALAIAKQIICQEITIDREIVVCVAREALAKVEDPGKIKIKMSPSDLQFIKENRSHLSDIIDNIDNVAFEAVESIQSGGCIIETDLGEIDARIEKQLQAVEESFRTALEKT